MNALRRLSGLHLVRVYLWTLSFLKPIQLLFLVYYRLRGPVSGPSASPHVVLREGVGFKIEHNAVPSSPDNLSFTFLNREKRFSTEVDWASKEMPKLWRYNLHYFDYLLDSKRSVGQKCRLLTDWIHGNPPGTDDAWEPYPLSLRIVNWIKFLLLEHDLPKQSDGRYHEWVESLYRQALWLERNIEYHILANHYLKNGKALFFAGTFFSGTDADRWRAKGLKILTEEAVEQFLADGGHYERSLMYHSICLEDYLDVINLMSGTPCRADQDMGTRFTKLTQRGLDFLHDVCLPDGEIPLFNDAAFGIAPSPDHLFEYARCVTGYLRPVSSATMTTVEKTETGYFVVRHGQDMMIVDCGAGGPDYQVGHAHCDALSYELALNGRRVIVDSGVFDYESTPERAYARSTRAHNTVMIDGMEQSEIWGVFRMARRARPLGGTLRPLNGTGSRFEGMHDGYSRLPGKVHHKRLIEYDGTCLWTVLDEVTGMGNSTAESYIHFHPDYSVQQNEAGLAIVKNDGKAIGQLEILGNASFRVDQGRYFPEFGRAEETTVLVLSCVGTLPLQFGYRVRKDC